MARSPKNRNTNPTRQEPSPHFGVQAVRFVNADMYENMDGLLDVVTRERRQRQVDKSLKDKEES